MIQLQKLKFLKKTTLISFLIVSLSLNFIYKVNPPSFDKQIKNSYGLISPKVSLDSSIVLLLIGESDLNELGGWPLKRSLYAQLIIKLLKQDVDKIAIEIIFSDTGESNTVFDSVINHSSKITLSSLLTNKDKFGNQLDSDSLIYSYPKTIYPKINSGHLNFFDEDEIIIPYKIISGSIEEKAFAVSVWGKDKFNSALLIKPNLYRRYCDAQTISLMDYLNEHHDGLSLKGKTVFIGRENKINSSSQLLYNKEDMTGLMLHAITYDNLKNHRIIYSQGSDFVNLFFNLIIIIFILFGGSKYRTLIWTGLVFLVHLIGFSLFVFFEWEFNYSNLFYIIVALGIIDYVYTRILKLL
jgi:CHASE2 domain-containing sensor protein